MGASTTNRSIGVASPPPVARICVHSSVVASRTTTREYVKSATCPFLGAWPDWNAHHGAESMHLPPGIDPPPFGVFISLFPPEPVVTCTVARGCTYRSNVTDVPFTVTSSYTG